MSDQVTTEQLQALLALAQQGQQSNTAMGMTGMMQMPMAGQQQQIKLQGVSVPVSVQTPIGKVRTQFILPPEYGANPMLLQQGIQQLMMMGYEIDAWQGSSGGGNGGSGFGNSGSNWGGGNRGNWGGNRGNWGR